MARKKKASVEKDVAQSLMGFESVLLIVVGLLIFSPSITGNVVGGQIASLGNLLGLVLIVIGLIGVFRKNP